MSTTLPVRCTISHDDTQWAARHMPLLAATMQTHSAAFAGRRVGICLHIEPKTAVLVSFLAQAGAQVTLTGSPGTTQEDTADALRASRRHRHRSPLGRPRPAPREHRAGTGLPAGPHPGQRRRPDRGRDGSGRSSRPRRGHRGDHHRRPAYPVLEFPAAFPRGRHQRRSRLKLLVENEFGVGQSVVQGFLNATNLMLPGAHATVVGYGPCGRGSPTRSPVSAPGSRWRTSTPTALWRR